MNLIRNVKIKILYLFIFILLFISLNYLQADIYLKIFKEKISKTSIELCVLNSCETYNYSSFLISDDVKEVSASGASNLALDMYLSIDLKDAEYFQDEKWYKIQEDYTKDDLLLLIHKSRYPNTYFLNYRSSIVSKKIDISKEISLELEGEMLNISKQELKKLIFIKDSELVINPLLFLNYLKDKEVDLTTPVLDLNNFKAFKNKKIPDFAKLVNSLNVSLNDNQEHSKIRVEYYIPTPIILSNINNEYSIQKVVFTSFYGSNFNRNFNIQNAIKKLQFIELMPNQEFSFLDSIGDISKETGYKDSLVITSEGFVSQAGGGVCQVSSTIYYAALHAGFPILERYNHSKAISYYAQAFDYGLDATIYPGQKDLRFKNTYPFKVILFSYYIDFTMQTLVLAPQEMDNVELNLIIKDVDHSQYSLVEINKDLNLNTQAKLIQNYIPKIFTLWERKIGEKTEKISSSYRSQPKILDYSNN